MVSVMIMKHSFVLFKLKYCRVSIKCVIYFVLINYVLQIHHSSHNTLSCNLNLRVGALYLILALLFFYLTPSCTFYHVPPPHHLGQSVACAVSPFSHVLITLEKPLKYKTFNSFSKPNNDRPIKMCLRSLMLSTKQIF